MSICWETSLDGVHMPYLLSFSYSYYTLSTFRQVYNVRIYSFSRCVNFTTPGSMIPPKLDFYLQKTPPTIYLITENDEVYSSAGKMVIFLGMYSKIIICLVVYDNALS